MPVSPRLPFNLSPSLLSPSQPLIPGVRARHLPAEATRAQHIPAKKTTGDICSNGVVTLCSTIDERPSWLIAMASSNNKPNGKLHYTELTLALGFSIHFY